MCKYNDRAAWRRAKGNSAACVTRKQNGDEGHAVGFYYNEDQPRLDDPLTDL